jgi:hypothetical protein
MQAKVGVTFWFFVCFSVEFMAAGPAPTHVTRHNVTFASCAILMGVLSHYVCSVGEFLGLFGILLLLVLVGRAAFVFPLSALSNYWTKSPTTKISLRHQVPTANLCMDGCFLIESFLLCGMCSFVTHCKFGLRESNTRVELFMKS